MKKALATIMGLAFAVSAMAQYLIYDYNVSFKRLNPQFTKVTYRIGDYTGKNKQKAQVTGYFDSFTTANDKLIGTVVIPTCKDCSTSDDAWEPFGSADYDAVTDHSNSAFAIAGTQYATSAFVVLMRNGDDLTTKNPNYKGNGEALPFTGKLVWVLQADIDSAIFGKGAVVRVKVDTADDCTDIIAEEPDYENKVSTINAAKEAWLILTYVVPELGLQVLPPVKMANDNCATYVDYGFLGYLSKNGSISNAGFGTATTVPLTTNAQPAFCGGKAKDVKKCQSINSISGSTVGIFVYTGICDRPALFDICTKEAFELDKGRGPIAGTFTFKLNASASKNYGGSKAAVFNYINNVKYKTTATRSANTLIKDVTGATGQDDYDTYAPEETTTP